MAKALVHDRRPWGSDFSHWRFDRVSLRRVHIAASRAMRLNSSPFSIPEQTLSWLPRMPTSGFRERSMSTVWFGLAP